MKYIFHAVKKVKGKNLLLTWTSLSYRECCWIIKSHISVICFKHWNLKVIIIQNWCNRFRRSGVDGYTGVCYCVSLLKNATSVCFFCVYRTVFHLRKRNSVFASFIFAWRTRHLLLGMYSSIFKKMIAETWLRHVTNQANIVVYKLTGLFFKHFTKI